VVVVARVLFFLYQITAVSAVIQAGLALPMIVYFHRVGLSGLTANALVVPLMGLAIPVGFVARVHRLGVGGSDRRRAAGRYRARLCTGTLRSIPIGAFPRRRCGSASRFPSR